MVCIRWSLALLVVNAKMVQHSEEELPGTLLPLLPSAYGLQVQPVTQGAKMPRFTAQPAQVLSEGVAPINTERLQRSQVPASLNRRTRIRIPTMQAVDGGSTVTMPALSSTMTEGKIS